jgi:Spy/CpxP family protein refolding chaperone
MNARLLLWLALPALVCAQPRPANLGWWDNPVASGLDLTEAQERQIRDIVREYRDRMIDAQAAVEKAENDLEDVFNEPTVDQRRGSEAIARLVAARAAQTKVVSEMTLRLRAVLTAGQWQELQRRERERTSGRGRRGPKSGKQAPGRPQVTGLR